MKCKLFLLFLLLPFLALSQRTFKKKYKEKLEPNSKMLEAGYNYTLEKTNSNDFIYKKYFPETKQITHFITFKTGIFKVKNGEYQEWLDDGSLWRKGIYINGLKNGDWQIADYQRVEIGKFYDDVKVGEWLKKDKLGRVREKYFFKEGVLEGEHLYYDTLGNLTSTGYYAGGVLVNVTYVDSTVIPVDGELPSFPGCENLYDDDYEGYKKCTTKKLLEYIYTRITYPSKARENDVQGDVLVVFTVDAKGVVDDVKVLRGLCKEIKEQSFSLVKNFPTWYRGKRDENAMPVSYILPIRYRLETKKDIKSENGDVYSIYRWQDTD